MKRCIYYDTTKLYHCEEICPLFCKSDDVVFGGLAPRIIFERSQTLGRGNEVCDFHIKNGNRYKKALDNNYHY